MITTPQFNKDSLRQAFGCFPSGVTAFCGIVDGKPRGMLASSFTSVSLDPALVSVCVMDSSTTWPKLAQLPRLGLSVLASEHEAVAWALASKDDDKFASVDWEASEAGAVFVHGSLLWLDCEPYDVIDAGDHKIVLLKVVALGVDDEISPMIFHKSGFCGLSATA